MEFYARNTYVNFSLSNFLFHVFLRTQTHVLRRSDHKRLRKSWAGFNFYATILRFRRSQPIIYPNLLMW